jgi:transposase
MASSSKSPKAVLVTAYNVAQRSMKAYSHRYSPKKFTQYQLFAILVFKAFLKTDYRGVASHLCDCPELAATIELRKVPHFTTLQKASRRLLNTPSVRALLDETVRRHMGRRLRVATAAIDSTGLECSSASGYFVRRRQKVGETWNKVVYHRYPKLGVICDVESHFIFAYEARRGPKPDVNEFRSTVTQALTRIRITTMLADAGYDSEGNHSFARDQNGIRTVIPAKHGRPTTKPASGRYRRQMQVRFNHDAYRQRSQVETVMSMIKRRQGSHIRGRCYNSQCRDLRLMVLTHNVMILYVPIPFLQSRSRPLF